MGETDPRCLQWAGSSTPELPRAGCRSRPLLCPLSSLLLLTHLGVPGNVPQLRPSWALNIIPLWFSGPDSHAATKGCGGCVTLGAWQGLRVSRSVSSFQEEVGSHSCASPSQATGEPGTSSAWSTSALGISDPPFSSQAEFSGFLPGCLELPAPLQGSGLGTPSPVQAEQSQFSVLPHSRGAPSL